MTDLPIDRRTLFGLAAAFGVASPYAAVRRAAAQSGRKGTLIIALDISDTTTLDPARVAQYSSPMTVHACYDSLITMEPGEYINVKPAVATEWGLTPDGKSMRFKIRQGIRFASGAPLTAEDVKFSLERIIHLKDQSQQYIAHVDRVEVVNPQTVDVVMNDPSQPLLTILAAPGFGITEKKVVEAHGGKGIPGAKDTDTATRWLDQNSAGSGPFRLVGWERNQQIQLPRNPHHWAGEPGYQRIVIRHMSESAAQLLALRRGDVDVAFNLIPEQIATLGDSPDITVMRALSLDYLYMAVSEDAQNPALAKKAARQAIGYAIDYDGIIHSFVAGQAKRPASFLPIGVNGSTEEIAKQVGFRQDLDRARSLLKEAGLPDGFSFDLSFANAAIFGVSYQLIAQKLQADLARVGIKANLAPMDQVGMRTQFIQGKLQSCLTYWNPPAVENQLWASATVNRVAQRVHWTPPAEIKKLVDDASAERDLAKAAAMWTEYQRQMVDAAHLIILIQPVYQVGVRKTVQDMHLTAAGWMAEYAKARPA